MPGLTITMSAPSSRSSSISRRASSVGRVHLIAAAVADCVAVRYRRVAERAIERAGVFRGVGHDRRSLKPAASSAARIAPTMPSIMPTERSCRAGPGVDQGLVDQDRDRLVVEDLALAQEAVMAVAGIGIERDVAQDSDIGKFLLDRADGAADQIVGIERLGSIVVAQRRVGVGEESQRRMPSLAARSASRTASSIDTRSTPGIEAIAMRWRAPSTTNSGQIRSSAVGAFSRTIRRTHGARRLRRGRTARSSVAGVAAAVPARKASIGRPNLIAMSRLQFGGTLFSRSSVGSPAAAAGGRCVWLVAGGLTARAANVKGRAAMSDQSQRRPRRPSDLLEPVHAADQNAKAMPGPFRASTSSSRSSPARRSVF